MNTRLLLATICIVGALTLGAATPVRAGLMGYWAFDGDVLDSSGNGNHGAVVGTEAYDASPPSQIGSGSAFDFNGGSSVTLPFMDFYAMASSTGGTLSMWVNAAPQNDKRLYGEAIGVGTVSGPFHGFGTGFSGNGTNDKLRWYIRTDDSVVLNKTGAITTFDSTWHHVLWVDSPGHSKLYVDGVADSTDFNYTHASSSIDTSTIGAVHYNGNPRTSSFSGSIDDAAMWNTVLPLETIRGLADGTYTPLNAPIALEFGHEPFAGYTTGAIHGQTVLGTGFAPGATWRTSGNSPANTVEAATLQYSCLPVSGGAFRSGGSAVRTFVDLDTSTGGLFDERGYLDTNGDVGADNSVLYMSWLTQSETAESSGYAGLAFFLGSDTSEQLFIGKLDDGQYGGTGGLGTFGTPLDTDTHMIVARFSFQDGNDQIDVFLDPDLTLPEHMQTIDGSTSLDLQFDRLRLSSGGGAGSWLWDEIRFGENWASVAQVPEPSAALLGLLGCLGLLLPRRRRCR